MPHCIINSTINSTINSDSYKFGRIFYNFLWVQYYFPATLGRNHPRTFGYNVPYFDSYSPVYYKLYHVRVKAGGGLSSCSSLSPQSKESIMAKNKNVFRDAAISAALQNVQLEMHNLSRRLGETTTPENVVAYINNVQLPRFQQILETLLALKEE